MDNTIGAKALVAAIWGTGGTVLRLGLQFGSQVVLARLLGPEQYGIFAIGALVVAFSSFFSDIGLAYGLIQAKTVDDRHIRFVFAWQLVVGAAVACLIWWSAAPIASFLGAPEARSVVAPLAMVCLLNAMAAPSLNLLKRRLDFKTIQIGQLAGLIAYVCVALALAFTHHGVASLVVAWIVQSFVVLLVCYGAVRHSLRPLIWFEGARGMSGYGSLVFATNLVNWCSTNIDRIVISRFMTARELGMYSTPYNAMYMPVTAVLSSLQPVFLSASIRLDGDRSRIQRGYLALIGLVALGLAPAFGAIAGAADPIVGLLYGSKWVGAGDALRPIALAMPWFLVFGFSTPLLWSAGQAHMEALVQLPILLVMAAALYAATRYSIGVVAWVAMVTFCLRALVIQRMALLKSGLLGTGTYALMAWGATLTAVSLAVSRAMTNSLRDSSPLFQAIASISASFCACVLAAIVSWKWLRPWVHLAVEPLASRFPARFRNVLNRWLLLST